MTSSIWSGVTVKMESALATALVITAITKANPAVVTYTGTDPSNGDYIKLSNIVGMSQLNNRVVRAANVNAGGNTFEVEGEDSTLFDTFVSGSAEVITFGTTIDTLTDLNASGGDPDEIPDDTIHDTVKTILYGAFNAAKYSFGSRWDAGNAGFKAMKASSDLKQTKSFMIQFPNLKRTLFLGLIAASGLPVGTGQGKVTTPVAITMNGRPTHYAT